MRVYKPRFRTGKGKLREARVYWVDLTVDGKRIRRSLETRDRQAAYSKALALSKKEEHRAAGLVTPFDDQLERHLGDHVQDFLTELASRRLSPVHLEDRERTLQLFVEENGLTGLQELDGPRASAWLKGRSDRGLSARTVNRMRAALLQFSRWLVRNRRLAYDPFINIRSLNEETDRRLVRRALTDGELRRLLDAARRRPLEQARAERKHRGVTPPEEARLLLLGETRALIYAFAAGTGLRKGEMLALSWKDLDLEKGTVLIPAAVAKSKRDQSVPLRKELAGWLKEYRWKSVKGEPQDPVFPSARFPQIRTFHSDLEAAGIARVDEGGRSVDFHALRGTFITSLAALGLHPRVVQALARHSSMELTMKAYTDLALFDVKGAVEGLPSLLPAAGVPRRRRGRRAGAGTVETAPAS